MVEFGPVAISDVIPAEVHGFTVTVAAGPYPPDAGHTHRRAVYAELRPATDETRRRMRKLGRDRILGMAPLNQQGAELISRDPQGREAEQAATLALAQASALAKSLMAA